MLFLLEFVVIKKSIRFETTDKIRRKNLSINNNLQSNRRKNGSCGHHITLDSPKPYTTCRALLTMCTHIYSIMHALVKIIVN